MGVSLASIQVLPSGNGFYSQSGEVACSTNTKNAITIVDSGYRDTTIELTFSGSTVDGNLTAGSISEFKVIINDTIVYRTVTNTVEPAGQHNNTYSFFLPRFSSLQVIVIDADTNGATSTSLKGYYLEKPVKQQI